MLTLKKVNKALEDKGIEDRLFKGKDYFYFWGPQACQFHETSVYVFRLSELTIEEWLQEYARLAMEE